MDSNLINEKITTVLKPLKKRIEDEIKSDILSKVREQYALASDIKVIIHNCEYTGISGFEIYVMDNEKSVFSCKVDVKLKSEGKQYEIIDGKTSFETLSHSIDSIRVSSNERRVNNSFEKTQILIAAVLMNCHYDFKKPAKEIKDFYDSILVK